MARSFEATCLVAGLVVVASCSQVERLPLLASKKASPPSGPRTEQEWILSDIVGSLLAMARYTRDRQSGTPEAFAITIQPNPNGSTPQFALVREAQRDEPTILTVDRFIWSPGTFRSLADALVGEIRAEDSAPRPDLLGALLDLRAESLEIQNQAVSKQLSAHPADPVLHEQAALLLAALSVREAAGNGFSDIRHQLSRITAHLTFAAALRRGQSPATEGRLAEALLLTLTGRTAEAIRLLDALQLPTEGATGSWVRAIRMRATRDWRLLHGVEAPSTIERLIHLRLVLQKVSQTQALRLFDQVASTATADWGRIMLEEPTAGLCNRLVTTESDLSEARRVLELRDPARALDDATIIASLNDVPLHGGIGDRDGLAFWVIDRGIWAAFAQRHLMFEMIAGQRCLQEILSLKERAETRVNHDQRLSKLRLFPFAAMQTAADQGAFTAWVNAALVLIRDEPEWVTPDNWKWMLEDSQFGAPRGVPALSRWFSPPMPVGVSFRSVARSYGAGNRAPLPIAQVEALIALDPYDSRQIFGLTKRKHGDPAPFNKLRDAWGTLADYDSTLAYQLARSARGKDQPAYEEWAKKACDLDVDLCRQVANWARESGDDTQAAAYYHRWFDGSADRVSVSNNVRWLVEYELARGKRQEALRLARAAAATYSAGGLETLGMVLERTGDIVGAERQYRLSSERYEAFEPLTAFYSRRIKAGERRYQARLDALAKNVFPNGMERIDTLDRSTPPREGASLVGSNQASLAAGLRGGEVIVGLNGFRIRNQQQYTFVHGLGEDPTLELVIWNGTKYVEVRAQPPGRKFGLPIRDFGSK